MLEHYLLTGNPDNWPDIMAGFLERASAESLLVDLSVDLARSPMVFRHQNVGLARARLWCDVWVRLASGCKEMDIGLRLLDRAVRYFEKPDPLIPLSLNFIERELLNDILESMETGKSVYVILDERFEVERDVSQKATL